MDTLGALFAYHEWDGPARTEVGRIRTLKAGQVSGSGPGRMARLEGGR
jgi:hypothetical protein